MKRFFLYFVLPSVVLGVVYQAGRNSAIGLPSSDRAVPSVMSSEDVDRKLAVVSEQISRLESLRSGQIPAVSQVASVPAAVRVANSENAVPVDQSVERYQFRQLPAPTGPSPGISPSADPPKPVAAVGGRPVKPSETGLMPLLPLGPSSSSVRVPALQKCDCGVEH